MKSYQRIVLLLVVAAWTLGWVHRLGAQPRPTTELLIAWPFTPISEFRPLHGVGPRIAEHTVGTIPLHPFPSYEDLRLKGP